MTEVDVCYLKGKYFESRKTMRYSTTIEASEVYKATVSKFRANGTKSLITLRATSGKHWAIIKSERT